MQVRSIHIYFFIVVVLLSNLSLIGQEKEDNKVLRIGDFEVYTLLDANIYLQVSLLSRIDEDEAKRLAGGNDSALTPVNAYLIKTPDHIVLVDAGIGKYPGEDSGHLLERMNEIGISKDSVDLILITHFHFDHIGGLISQDGTRLFPNAVIRAPKTESDFWMRDSLLIPESLRKRAASIKSILNPYISANAYQTFLPEEDLANGVKGLSANGHTPGHSVYTFISKGKEFWCIGDLIHFGDIQFKHPNASIIFDSDPEMAINMRADFFNRAAKSGIILGGAHLPKIVLLEKSGETFIAKPVTSN